jgi:hypothetical protein
MAAEQADIVATAIGACSFLVSPMYKVFESFIDMV